MEAYAVNLGKASNSSNRAIVSCAEERSCSENSQVALIMRFQVEESEAKKLRSR